MIQEYKLKDGTKRYKVRVYIGIDSLTGKQKEMVRKGFKSRKEATLEEER